MTDTRVRYYHRHQKCLISWCKWKCSWRNTTGDTMDTCLIGQQWLEEKDLEVWWKLSVSNWTAVMLKGKELEVWWRLTTMIWVLQNAAPKHSSSYMHYKSIIKLLHALHCMPGSEVVIFKLVTSDISAQWLKGYKKFIQNLLANCKMVDSSYSTAK